MQDIHDFCEQNSTKEIPYGILLTKVMDILHYVQLYGSYFTYVCYGFHIYDFNRQSMLFFTTEKYSAKDLGINDFLTDSGRLTGGVPFIVITSLEMKSHISFGAMT